MSLHIIKGNKEELAFYNNYFGQLEGATIMSFSLRKDADFGDWWPTYVVRMKDGTMRTIEISQDEEGNGPGFVFGLDSPRSAA